MYNLIIGMTSGIAPADRLFEHTDDQIKAAYSDQGGPVVERLMSLPSLLMPEVQTHGGEPSVARVGRIPSLRRVGRNYEFPFAPHPLVPAIPLARVVEL